MSKGVNLVAGAGGEHLLALLHAHLVHDPRLEEGGLGEDTRSGDGGASLVAVRCHPVQHPSARRAPLAHQSGTCRSLAVVVGSEYLSGAHRPLIRDLQGGLLRTDLDVAERAGAVVDRQDAQIGR